MDWVFWVIFGGILLAILVTLGSIYLGKRRNEAQAAAAAAPAQ
ncbi:hypothetical protein GCM10009785_26080 [Brooklawnia cerclae]|uniref:LPXTG cell wall anchor domain-containing protein n=1 Tax=Brooklawnia cerclae TaxID=349934 RepID=A0ABX0SL05_9ACTN|nr:hypothetical protein [Brooklawnia cerclae]NIH57386.1 hypothetical protein [Brooklawnia cerclae]